MSTMTRKNRPTVRILFMAIVPIGAWLAVLYFSLIVVESSIRVLELWAKVIGNS